MTSPLVTQQLQFECHASWHYCLVSSAIHSMALVSIGLAGLPVYWVVAASLALLLSWVMNIWSAGLRRTAGAVTEIQLDESGWRLGLRSGEQLIVTLLPEVVLLPWLVVLRFKSQGRHLSVALFPDSVPAPGLRRLRAILRVYSAVD